MLNVLAPLFTSLRPWLALGFVLALVGSYFYGHHEGYTKRGLEAMADAAKVETWARQQERRQAAEQVDKENRASAQRERNAVAAAELRAAGDGLRDTLGTVTRQLPQAAGSIPGVQDPASTPIVVPRLADVAAMCSRRVEEMAGQLDETERRLSFYTPLTN